MSYCRFSSDNYKSNYYIYSDTRGGYSIHIAERKRVAVDPVNDPIPIVTYTTKSNWMKQYQEQQNWLDDDSRSRWEYLPKPIAGAHYNVKDLSEVLEVIYWIQAKYDLHIPSRALANLKAEYRNEQRSIRVFRDY